MVCKTVERNLAQHYTDAHTSQILKTFDVAPLVPLSSFENLQKLPHTDQQGKVIPNKQTKLRIRDNTQTLPNAYQHPRTVNQQMTGCYFLCGQVGCSASYNSIVDFRLHHEQAHKDIAFSKAIYRCPTCSLIFTYPKLVDHIDEDLCLQCKVCKHVCSSKSELILHGAGCGKEEMKKDGSYIKRACKDCGKLTSDALHCSGFECEKCPRSFTSRASLKQHVKRAHAELKKYHCPLCQYVNFSFDNVCRHSREHFKDHLPASICSSFQCTLCDYGCDDKRFLRSHIMTTHSADGETNFLCGLCSTRSTSSEKVFEHMVVNHCIPYDSPLALPPDVPTFKCSECHESVSNITDVIVHINKHSSTTPMRVVKSSGGFADQSDGTMVVQSFSRFPCPICDHTSREIQATSKHIKTHFKDLIPESEYSCIVCTFCLSSFSSQMTLGRHVRNCHFSKNNEVESCKQCGEDFATVQTGWKHVVSHQTDYEVVPCLPENVQPFKCRFCGVCVRDLAELVEHARMHRGEDYTEAIDKTLWCSQCSLRFNSVCQAEYHHKSTHNARFKCTLCDSCYGFGEELSQHVSNNHLIGASEQCLLCGEQITTTEQCIQHVSQHNILEEESSDDVLSTQCDKPRCGICKDVLISTDDYVTHGTISDCVYKCVICFKSLDDADTLQSHLISQHFSDSNGNDPLFFPCKCCKKIFMSGNLLKRHWTWTHNKEFHCVICCKPLLSLSECNEHLECHFKDQEGLNITCCFCGDTLLNEATAVHHSTAHYAPNVGNRNAVHCKVCSETLSDGTQAYQHYIKHSSHELNDTCSIIQVGACVICDEQLNDQTHMPRHVHAHYNGRKSHAVLMQCLKCEKVCNLSGFRYHQKESHGASDIEVAGYGSRGKRDSRLCDICGATFTDPYSYNRHLKCKPSLYCELCDYKTHNIFALLEHLESSHDGENSEIIPKILDMIPTMPYQTQRSDRPFVGTPCEGCGKRFTDSWKKKRHLKAKPVLSCELCDYKTHGGEELLKHVEVTHEGEINTVKQKVLKLCKEPSSNHTGKRCEACGKVFQDSWKKNRHVKSKPILCCDLCDYKTHGAEVLRQHVKTTHEGENSPVKQKTLGLVKTSANTDSVDASCEVCGTNFVQAQCNNKPKILCCHSCCNLVYGVQTVMSQFDAIYGDEKILLKKSLQASLLAPLKNKKSSGVIDDTVGRACEACGKVYSSRSKKYRHQRFSPILTCVLLSCEYLTHDKQSLINHLTKLHKDDESDVKQTMLLILQRDVDAMTKCGVCNQTFITADRLKQHLRTLMTYHCHLCTFKSHLKASVTDHIFENHGDEPRHQRCDALERIKLAEDNRPRELCSFCGSLVLQYSMQEHMRKIHNFSCEFCEFVSKTKEELQNHRKKKHSHLFICEVCEMDCGSETGLEDHLALNFGKPVYKCNNCDFTAHFETATVNKHLQEHHYSASGHPQMTRRSNKKSTTEYTTELTPAEARTGKVHDRGGKRRPHICEHCHALFSTAITLEEHKKQMHRSQSHTAEAEERVDEELEGGEMSDVESENAEEWNSESSEDDSE